MYPYNVCRTRLDQQTSFPPHDFAVLANNQHDDVARAIRKLTSDLKHRYTYAQIQSIGDEKFLAIQKLDFVCPML